MKLKQLVSGIYLGEIPDHFKDYEIRALGCDSRIVSQDSLFVALKGPRLNGSDFIFEAIKKGVRVIVGSKKEYESFNNKDVCFLQTEDTRRFLCDISQRFYDYPSRKIKAIGVTGTNGKTTITYLLESIFCHAQKSCAVIGTINHRIGQKVIPSKNTTPGLLEMQEYLSDMIQQKIDYCVIEASSHAL